jgi:flagellin-like hook-associated protein FlgL
MSGIVLSSSVRQNLLSLQSTASLLATTQNDLATGNAVNSALDNPTNFFTAAGLNNRASDIGNLLDSIGNGVQVLQAANTGITSLQSLVSSAQSIANQVLQTPVGYSTKSNITSAAITGATANNLLGTGNPATNAVDTGTADLSSGITDPGSGNNITFSINSHTVTIAGGSGNISLTALESAINTQVGASAKVDATDDGSGHLVLTSTNTPGSSDTITVGGTDAATVVGTATSATGTAATTVGSLSGETLTIGATGGGTATSITFGTGANQISTLNGLNTALAANNLQATIDASTGKINIVTSNDAASSTIGTLGGTAVSTTGAAFSSVGTPPAAVADPDSQATRASLVAQYNNVLQQINTTASDSSFNGVNLLNGDTLKLVFNETGTSTLSITGVTFNGAGLGLSSLKSGTDFLDNNSANTVLTQLQNASTTLRGEASTLGSNLSIVQIRQDFNKSLINVLQTGASNLTLADPNQEAADSQALSTRQSIAVSALALANQSQQSVLQLLR